MFSFTTIEIMLELFKVKDKCILWMVEGVLKVRKGYLTGHGTLLMLFVFKVSYLG